MMMTRMAAAVPLLLAGLLAGPGMFAAQSAVAQTIDYKHTIFLAGDQRMLSQRISKEVVLIALGYNVRENLRNLRSNHDKFERVLKGLHYGDAELALVGSNDPGVLENLTRVEELWPLFESALQDSMANGKATHDAVSIVSDLSLPLLQAMEDTVDSYEEEAAKNALFSMLEIAIDLTDELAVLSQKMSKEFLLVAYGLDPEQNRARLKETTMEFEKLLNALMLGDAELRLIPAPSQRIHAQFKAVQRLWKEFKPLIETAMKGKEINEDLVSDVASLNLTMLNETLSAVSMYEAL